MIQARNLTIKIACFSSLLIVTTTFICRPYYLHYGYENTTYTLSESSAFASNEKIMWFRKVHCELIKKALARTDCVEALELLREVIPSFITSTIPAKTTPVDCAPDINLPQYVCSELEPAADALKANDPIKALELSKKIGRNSITRGAQAQYITALAHQKLRDYTTATVDYQGLLASTSDQDLLEKARMGIRLCSFGHDQLALSQTTFRSAQSFRIDTPRMVIDSSQRR